MSKHTPGPWKIVTERYGLHSFDSYIDEITIHTAYDDPQLHGPAPVVTMATSVNVDRTPLHTVYIGEANARLIAAAPDLLEALHDAHATLSAMRLKSMEKLVERFGDVLAKARGDQS